MIVDLHKYLIYGQRAEIDRFFTLAQRAGFMEFIGLSHKKALELPEDAKSILTAIKIARQHMPEAPDAYIPLLDPYKLSETIIALKEREEKLLEEERLAKSEIARIAVFGNFSRAELDEFERLGKRVVQFFCMKSDLARELAVPQDCIYIGTEYDLAYFVAINKEPVQHPKMIEIVIEKPVGELKKRLEEIQREIKAIEREIHHSANALPYLQEGLADALNEHHLKLCKHDAALSLGDSLFAIEAWIPETKIKALNGVLSSLHVSAEEIAIEAHDVKPTLMENRGAGKLGEDLVHVYDTPSPTDKDPSLWLLVFFSFFFAMIVSDAGYGLVFFLTGLFLKWKSPKAEGFTKRFIRLTLIAGASCMIWGVATASFFGIAIGPNNPFRKTSFLHYMAVKKAEYHMRAKDEVYREYVHEFPAVATATDGHDFLLKASKTDPNGQVKYNALDEFYDNILLEFSLLVGLIHISLSFLRYLFRNWTGAGWILFMVGGYLYFPSMLHATSILNFMGWIPKTIAYPVGEQLLYIGLGLVFVISLLQGRRWGALHELTNAIQVFADVLSYLRLYALALAGMIMAATFNEMGMKMGIVGGFLIILIGHIVNMSLAIMAGVIHGLRLNFLEWYHYSFEGGGRLFNPLRLRKTK